MWLNSEQVLDTSLKRRERLGRKSGWKEKQKERQKARRGEGEEKGEENNRKKCMFIYDWVTMLYRKNSHNNVNQLCFNKKIK